MNIDLARYIDRKFGVPLCFLASMLVVFKRFTIPQPTKIRSVLFIELSELGSTVLALPAMRFVKNETGAALLFATFARNRESVAVLGLVPDENVFCIRDDNLWTIAVDTVWFLLWSRRKKIDSVIDLELFSRFTALLTGLSGSRRRVGFHRVHGEGLYRGNMLTHPVAYNAHIHIAQNFLALTHALVSDSKIPYIKQQIKITDELQAPPPRIDESVLGRLKLKIETVAPNWKNAQRVILINPNASELLPQRRWSSSNFAQLIQKTLSEYTDVFVIVTGARSEMSDAIKLVDSIGNPRCITLAGTTRFAELQALFSVAVLLVSNDSGPAHFAAISGLPTIVLFGPERPGLYQPLGTSVPIYAGLGCSPCVSASNHRKTSCDDNICMQAISIERVFVEIKKILGPGTVRSVPAD
jgi:ADP-heptose:LPS heptosyltransferase